MIQFNGAELVGYVDQQSKETSEVAPNILYDAKLICKSPNNDSDLDILPGKLNIKLLLRWLERQKVHQIVSCPFEGVLDTDRSRSTQSLYIPTLLHVEIT